MEGSKNAEDFKAKLNEVSNKYKNLLQETHNRALFQNEIQTKRWEDYKKEHLELSDRLMCLRDKLSHPIMVPIGKRALMRGRLVHTNEILVCLGDGWFAKQSAKQAAEICHRRIENCDEMLSKLKKEEELLNSRKAFPFENEAFCENDQTQEIIEPYNEEEEKQWREKHRQKEKNYRKKLAELRKSSQTKIETEEDLWRRLDALDQQEELEDELNRMEEDIEDDDEDYEDSGSDSDDDVEEQYEKMDLQRRVSFKGEQDIRESDQQSDTSDNDAIRIFFRHSETPVLVTNASGDELKSPSDIYLQYLKKKTPKSILKQSSLIYHPANIKVEETHSVVAPSEVEVNIPSLLDEPAIKAVCEEVVERTSSSKPIPVANRPISRFKAARMASKR